MKQPRRTKHVVLATGIVVLTILLIQQVLSYTIRPQIRYRLKKADCTPAAIAARNETLGTNLKSCVLVISATNLKNKPQYVDYDGIGGGPGGAIGSKPLIRIYTTHNRFCYVLLGDKGPSFAASATNELVLWCSQTQHSPKNYDATSDTSPVLIEIGGQQKVTLDVNPVR